MAKVYDAAVLGGTASGLAAAISLAQAGKTVVVAEAPCSATESPLADWVPRDFFDHAPFLKPLAKTAAAEPFEVVRFYNGDLTRSAEYRPGKVAGYTLPAGKLVAGLRQMARGLKVAFVAEEHWAGLRLEEDRVCLLGERPVESRVVLIAQARPMEVIGELSLPVRSLPRGELRVAGLDVPCSAGRWREGLAGVLHVVDLPERGKLAMFFAAGAALHVRVISDTPEANSPANDLPGLLGMMRASKLLPDSASLDRARGALWQPPGGVALELEAHVAKRTLLIGTAGGFADVTTGQTVAPSVRSALAAAEVCLKALSEKASKGGGKGDIQGALGAFKTEWRKGLADSIRPPNTSLHLLLPLLFINQQMVTRFAKAMLYGESM